MDRQGEQNRQPGAGQSGKRKYEPPEILSQEIFETTALACGKVFGGGPKCNTSPKNS
jgi:hypothetical protein